MLAEIKLAQGNPVAAQSLLEQEPLDSSPSEGIWQTRFLTALYLRDYDAANRRLKQLGLGDHGDNSNRDYRSESPESLHPQSWSKTTTRYAEWPHCENYRLLLRPAWLNNTTITLGVNNVFDLAPPFVAGAGENGYDEATANIKGRTWYVALTKRF
jgi:hypothetical protein